MAAVARAPTIARLQTCGALQLFLFAHPPHRLPQSRRVAGSGRRLPAAQPIPRRHHRRAHASLKTQAGIISAAIAASATVETDTITIDPEKLLQIAPNQNAERQKDDEDLIEFSINPTGRPGAASPRHADPHPRPHLRSRRPAAARFRRCRCAAPPCSPRRASRPAVVAKAWIDLRQSSRRRKSGAPPRNGRPTASRCRGRRGVRRPNRVGGAESTPPTRRSFRSRRRSNAGRRDPRRLLLSTQGGDIDTVIASERWALLRVFLVLATVMLLLSLLLATPSPSRCANWPKRPSGCGAASDRASRSPTSRPLRRDRPSSGTLRDMTQALYNRIDAIGASPPTSPTS